MKRNIVYLSRFPANPSGNGGDKRVAQLCDALSPIAVQFVSLTDMSLPYDEKLIRIVKTPSGGIQEKLSSLYKRQITYKKYSRWSEGFRDYILDLHILTNVYIKSLSHGKPDLLLIDDPVFLAPLVYYAKANNIPLVAICHNIETLSRDQLSCVFQREMFAYELDLIGQADLVVTISKEETFLLRNLGMNPLYFPYFPLKKTLDSFLQVRNYRTDSPKSNFLLFGTVYNVPTLEGMRKTISAISNSDILGHDRLIIGGYGTRERIAQADDSRIEVRGDLSDGELYELLSSIKGCIVYQDNGSGALTKIPELLAAGVPVIVNSHAARSHHNLPGIFEFENFDGLRDQMEAAAKSHVFPHVLSPPDTEPLINRILALVK
jgi:hypothetical protein